MVLGLWAGVYGLVDRVTWGTWFSTPLTYLRFNLSPDDGGAAPPFYYLTAPAEAVGPLAVVVALLAVVGSRKAPWLGAVVLGYFLAHSVISHKELRYLIPVLPLVASLAGLGLQALYEHRRRVAHTAEGTLVALTLLSTVAMGQTPFAGMGNPWLGAVNRDGSQNLLLFAAHDQPDLCGLFAPGPSPILTGGYTYLHRPVPLYWGRPRGTLARGYTDQDFFNYMIVRRGQLKGQEVAVIDELALVRLNVDHCRETMPPYPFVACLRPAVCDASTGKAFVP